MSQTAAWLIFRWAGRTASGPALRRLDVRRRIARVLAALLCAAAVATAAAAPRGPGTPRSELRRWLAELHDARAVDVTAPADWRYIFADADGRKLEALSLRLVRDGYRVVSLRSEADRAELQVAKVELHTPATLERRNSALLALAREFGVRSYDGVDVVPSR
jgi:hypothetical protein